MILVVCAMKAVSEKCFKTSKRSKTMIGSIMPKSKIAFTKIEILIHKIDIYKSVNVFIASKDSRKE